MCCRLQVVPSGESYGGNRSNGSLLPGLWRDSLHVTCGLTACTPGWAPGPTLGNEYGKTLPFTFLAMVVHRYKLKDDVRESLYDACNEWTLAVRKSGQTFMGGDCPNLADLVSQSLTSCDLCTDWSKEDAAVHSACRRVTNQPTSHPLFGHYTGQPALADTPS